MINSYFNCLRRYILFKGRTSPLVFSHFFYVLLWFALTAFFIWQILDWGNFEIGSPLSRASWRMYPWVYGSIGFLLLHVPAFLSAMVRRLRDAGYKSRALWLLFLPVLGWLILIQLLNQGTHEKFTPKNKYPQPSFLQELHHPLTDNTRSAPHPRSLLIEKEQAMGRLMRESGREKTLSATYKQGLGNFSPIRMGESPKRATQGADQQAAHASFFTDKEVPPPSLGRVFWTDFYLTGIEKYATFQGRAKRGEYFSFLLFLLLFFPLPLFLDGLLGFTFTGSGDWTFLNITPWARAEDSDLSLWGTVHSFYEGHLPFGYLSLGYFLLSVTPLLALQVRRINDTGRKGTNYLWYLILPILGLIILWIISLKKSRK